MYRRGNEFWRPRGTTLDPPTRIAGRVVTRGTVNKTTTASGGGGMVRVKKSSGISPGVEGREIASEE